MYRNLNAKNPHVSDIVNVKACTVVHSCQIVHLYVVELIGQSVVVLLLEGFLKAYVESSSIKACKSSELNVGKAGNTSHVG